jgi:hypothetical protein
MLTSIILCIILWYWPFFMVFKLQTIFLSLGRLQMIL